MKTKELVRQLHSLKQRVHFNALDPAVAYDEAVECLLRHVGNKQVTELVEQIQEEKENSK